MNQHPVSRSIVPPSTLKDLSPWSARLCLAAERFISQVAPLGLRGGSLVLALSGGLDSTALAIILKLLAPRLGITLLAAHLDHGLRPQSGRDASFCAAFCEQLSITCRVASLDVRALAAGWNTGIEDAGRRARYAWLEEVRGEAGALAVATGHQLDDLAEDQLMRLTRGAGWPALGGMPAWDDRRRVLRPLLMTPRADLHRFLTELGLPWLTDDSNDDPAFTRNRFRQNILPLFVRENPDFLSAAAELWRQARVDEKHWDDEVLVAEKAGFSGADRGLLTGETLRRSSQALRLRLYKRAVESLGPGQALSGALHGLDDAWHNRATGKRFQFPGGKEALVERGGIRFIPGPLCPRGPGDAKHSAGRENPDFQDKPDVDTSLPEG